VRNFLYNPKERVSSDNYSVKIDHHFGAKDYIFGRISQGWGENFLSTGLPEPANQAPTVDLSPRQVMISETHTFTPSLVNEFRIGQVFTRNSQDVSGPRLTEQFGIKGTLQERKIKGLPQFTISGFTTLGTGGPGDVPIPAPAAAVPLVPINPARSRSCWIIFRGCGTLPRPVSCGVVQHAEPPDCNGFSHRLNHTSSSVAWDTSAQLVEKVQEEIHLHHPLPLGSSVGIENPNQTAAVRSYIVGPVYTEFQQSTIGPRMRRSRPCKRIATRVIGDHHDPVRFQILE
jgi:hypothetical protein